MQRTKALYEKKGYPKDWIEKRLLGEAATTRITQDRNSQGLPKLKRDAKDGGAIAGRTRKDIEQQTGTEVISKENFLPGERRKQIKGN